MSSIQNLVLSSLGDAAARLTERGERVQLAFNAGLFETGDRVDWVYFPEGGLISSLNMTANGQLTETGLVGYEGACGMIEACGTGVAVMRSIVQVDGPAWRVPAEACRELAADPAIMTARLIPLFQFQLTESRQSALCRSFHPAEARLARWLLESRERSTRTDSLPMTQEFLAGMLGVRRTTVTAFIGELQHRDLIRYQRGRLDFVDVEGLEAVACECRAALVEERARLERTLSMPMRR